MGPLSRIRTVLESARLSNEDSVEFGQETLRFVEQTVLLRGQALKSISYY